MKNSLKEILTQSEAKKREKRKGIAKGLLIGSLIGGAIGVLYAPDSGKNTRKKIKIKAYKVKDQVGDNLLIKKDIIQGKYYKNKLKLKEFLENRNIVFSKSFEEEDSNE